MKWKCYAKPAGLGGKTCGHENDGGLRLHGLLCCSGCGCTKAASDYREAKLAKPALDSQVARSA